MPIPILDTFQQILDDLSIPIRPRTLAHIPIPLLVLTCERILRQRIDPDPAGSSFGDEISVVKCLLGVLVHELSIDLSSVNPARVVEGREGEMGVIVMAVICLAKRRGMKVRLGVGLGVEIGDRGGGEEVARMGLDSDESVDSILALDQEVDEELDYRSQEGYTVQGRPYLVKEHQHAYPSISEIRHGERRRLPSPLVPDISYNPSKPRNIRERSASSNPVEELHSDSGTLVSPSSDVFLSGRDSRWTDSLLFKRTEPIANGQLRDRSIDFGENDDGSVQLITSRVPMAVFDNGDTAPSTFLTDGHGSYVPRKDLLGDHYPLARSRFDDRSTTTSSSASIQGAKTVIQDMLEEFGLDLG
jgi:hypothetical protein